MIRAFFADEKGATAIEYGLVAGLVTVAVIAAIAALGGGVNGLYNNGTAELLANRAATIK